MDEMDGVDGMDGGRCAIRRNGPPAITRTARVTDFPYFPFSAVPPYSSGTARALKRRFGSISRRLKAGSWTSLTKR